LTPSVPGRHYGQVTDAQLAWLAGVLDVPAPSGPFSPCTHPPWPTVADLAVEVELVEQASGASVLADNRVLPFWPATALLLVRFFADTVPVACRLATQAWRLTGRHSRP